MKSEIVSACWLICTRLAYFWRKYLVSHAREYILLSHIADGMLRHTSQLRTRVNSVRNEIIQYGCARGDKSAGEKFVETRVGKKWDNHCQVKKNKKRKKTYCVCWGWENSLCKFDEAEIFCKNLFVKICITELLYSIREYTHTITD